MIRNVLQFTTTCTATLPPRIFRRHYSTDEDEEEDPYAEQNRIHAIGRPPKSLFPPPPYDEEHGIPPKDRPFPNPPYKGEEYEEEESEEEAWDIYPPKKMLKQWPIQTKEEVENTIAYKKWARQTRGVI